MNAREATLTHNKKLTPIFGTVTSLYLEYKFCALLFTTCLASRDIKADRRPAGIVVSQLGLVVRCLAGKRKDAGSTPLLGSENYLQKL